MLLQYKVSRIPSLLLLLLLNLAASQNPNESELNFNRNRGTSDPVSNFFSELGDLILDVDRTIAVQNQPKIEHEANVMSQLFRPQPDYFDRIQKNYRNMQKRLGKLIGDTIGFKNTYSDQELSTVKPPSDSFVPKIAPDYNPFAAAAEARKGKLKEKISKVSLDNRNKKPATAFKPEGSITEALDDSLKAFGKLSKTIIDDIADLGRKNSPSKSDKIFPKRSGSLGFLDECGNEVLEDPDLEERRRERCSRIITEERTDSDLEKLVLEPKRITEALLSKNSKAFDTLSRELLGRSGDALLENDETAGVDEKGSRPAFDKTDECTSEALSDTTLEKIKKEKCDRIMAEERILQDLNKLLLDSKRASEQLIALGSKSTDDLSSILLKRSGDDQDGGIFPSDSSFDKRLRELIKDHGSWILDYPLLKRWRQRDRSSDNTDVFTEQNYEDEQLATEENSSEIEPTELYMPVSTDYELAFKKSGEISEDPHESSYYRIVNEDGDVSEEEVDIVLDPESLENDIETIESQEPKETVILAFTSDGVPLKLRLGPEIDNPLLYLHKVLKSAGVSLNIPVESYDDLEPVGKEIFKLGSGILSRAVLINVSNSNDLKSLLKALMASKSSGRTTF